MGLPRILFAVIVPLVFCFSPRPLTRKVRDLGPGAGVSTYPIAINDCGEVIGNNATSHGAFLYTHGGYVALAPLIALPKELLLELSIINNLGQIFGTTLNLDTGEYDSVLLTPTVLEKCGSDATIDNNPDSATIAAGDTITYTIKVKNLDTATTQFTVSDELDATTTYVNCTVNGGGGTCNGAPGSHTISAVLPSLAKGATATITVQVKAASTYNTYTVLMNTATLSSSLTADYLSTAYTSVP